MGIPQNSAFHRKFDAAQNGVRRECCHMDRLAIVSLYIDKMLCPGSVRGIVCIRIPGFPIM